ncbi:MAG: Ig domain-containing protein [Lachnospiraceae bacterium]|nr:Ig domain-containing protein [Lachnospiraceae bacterium]
MKTKSFKRIIAVFMALFMLMGMIAVGNPAQVKADTIYQASSMEFGKMYTGYISKGDYKFYKISLPKSGYIYWEVADIAVTGTDYSYIEVYREGDVVNPIEKYELTYNSNLGYKVNSGNWKTWVFAGNYYIKISADCATSKSYTIRTLYKSSDESFTESYDSNYTYISEAPSIKENTFYKGAIVWQDLADIYKFKISKKSTLKFLLQDLESEYWTAGFVYNYMNVSILNGKGEELKSYRIDADKCSYSPYSFVCEDMDPGTYYFKIEGSVDHTYAFYQGNSRRVLYKFKYSPVVGVSYKTFVQKKGWQKEVADGAFSGTSGQALRLEAFRVKLINPPYEGSVMYNAYVQKIGWQGWKSNGQTAGTTNKGYRMEAIKVKLSKTMATKYDVYYRVYSQKFGWSGWAKNGNAAGSAGYGYRLEGMQVKLVTKNGTAPGSAKNAYRQKK